MSDLTLDYVIIETMIEFVTWLTSSLEKNLTMWESRASGFSCVRSTFGPSAAKICLKDYCSYFKL
jgi:hypothetical protein